MTRLSKIPAGAWWHAVGSEFETLREYLTRAKAADERTTGHDCGHEWTITVTSRLHTSGPGEHRDADWTDDCEPVTVRAHCLRDALLLAAAEPLRVWFPDEDSEQPDDTHDEGGGS